MKFYHDALHIQYCILYNPNTEHDRTIISVYFQSELSDPSKCVIQLPVHSTKLHQVQNAKVYIL